MLTIDDLLTSHVRAIAREIERTHGSKLPFDVRTEVPLRYGPGAWTLRGGATGAVRFTIVVELDRRADRDDHAIAVDRGLDYGRRPIPDHFAGWFEVAPCGPHGAEPDLAERFIFDGGLDLNSRAVGRLVLFARRLASGAVTTAPDVQASA